MKILFDSFDNIAQNPAGGVQMRINKIKKYLSENKQVDVKLFNKWEDKIQDFDILHIFKITIDSYNLCMLAKERGIKIVISAVIPPSQKIKVKTMLRIPVNTCYDLIKKSLDIADAIICQTNKEANFIEKIYGIERSKIKIIPNGVEERFKYSNEELFRNKFNIKDEFLLQVGRFDENKNQLNVIKAMKNSDVKIVFIGGEDSSFKDYYKKCKQNSSENIIFLGWISNEDEIISSAYKAAKALILPSFSEIFGNSLIEGGMAGCNLIATEALPIEEWGIEDYCTKINPNNINEIKLAIEKAMNKDKNDQISNIIEKKFAWKNIANMHLKLYKEVLK